ncbi:MAG: class I SAM-dependent methyltransferase [Actinomycetota bacterium]|nr:class I SAM-dependent methyltransferase [Actinomycetota bacterium]
MNKHWEHVNCNLCGADDAHHLFLIKHFQPNFNVVKCRRCELVYMNPRPPFAYLKKLYGKDYYGGEAQYTYGDERKNAPANKVIHEKRLSVIEKFVGRGRILDVGCAFGLLLEVARERGWQPYGLEISEYPAEYVRQQLKIDVLTKDITEADYPDCFFDAVVMVELIEHLLDPLGALKEVWRVLRVGGVAVIQTANIDSLKARIWRDKWEYFLPGHTYCFSKTTLTKMLEKTGFRVEKIYVGDELGYQAKIRKYYLTEENKNKSRPKKFLDIAKIVSKHTFRRISIANLTVGGMVFYARKPS